MGKSVYKKVDDVIKDRDKERDKKEHVPTETTRADVVKYSSIGLPADVIATLIGVSESTLKRHYIPELQDGQAKKKVMIASWAFGAAKKGKDSMIMFLCKTQLGWRETDRLELTGQNGGPIQLQPMIDRPPSETREQWEERRKREIEAKE